METSCRDGLRGIRWILLSETARQGIQERLRALLRAGAIVRPCHLREVRFKLGHKLTAYYDAVVSTEGSQGYRVRPIAVTWGAENNTERQEEAGSLAKFEAESVRSGVAAPLQPDSPTCRMRIQVWPVDVRFQQLTRLSDPRHVGALLADACAPGNAVSEQRRNRKWKITVIKYRPGKRHALRYDAEDAETGATAFAKLYVGEDGARAFRVAQGVADWLAEYGWGVNGLRPLAYVPEDTVVLYPRVCGAPLTDSARQLSRDSAQWLQRAGAALRALHQIPDACTGALGPPRAFAAEIRLITRLGHHIPALLPEEASAIQALLDRAQELHERLPQEPATFAHGDVKTDHFWVTPDGLTAMDFDSSGLADPARDMGYFLADLEWWHATNNRPRLLEAQERFLGGYVYVPGVPKARLLRARLYEAIKLVKIAIRRLQLFEDDWACRTAQLVKRAEAVMNDLERTVGSAGHRFGRIQLLATSPPPCLASRISNRPF